MTQARRTAIAIHCALRLTAGSPEERVTELAEQFELHPRHIRLAIDYAADHRDIIDAQVAANDVAAERARVLAIQRAEMLAG